MLRHVRALVPDEDVVYLADTAHVPYGDRTSDDLVRLMADNVATLVAAGVDAIVMGCNTSCAVAAKRGWPAARVPILDLIGAAADDVAAAGLARVGVIATAATAASGAYGDAIRARMPGARVAEAAAPALVPLVEAGTLRGPVARAAVAGALAAFDEPFDVLVLACTHYPFLLDHFTALVPANVRVVDPSRTQGERAAALVASRRPAVPERGRTRFLTTGSLDAFRAALAPHEVVRPFDTVERATPIVARR